MIEARFDLRRGDFHLDAQLCIPSSGVTAIFGSSGCGKTTLLRAIAGLESCRDGELRIDGESWQRSGDCLPVHKRAIGYVFQEASLFEHLSVRGNLAYAQRRAKPHSQTLPFEQVVELVGIGALLDRHPAKLSGGERQRVAIARALLAAPRLLLMDEPLAALDREAKQSLLPFLERLHGELDIPLLYVSHDPDEVARLADHLVLMQQGRVIASGPTEELLTRPDLPLARGDEAEALITAEVLRHHAEDHLTELGFSGGSFLAPLSPHQPGEQVRLRVLARDVSLTLSRQTDTSILNIFPVVVSDVSELSPAQLLVRLDAGGTVLLARITRRSARLLQLAPGTALYAQVKTVALLA